MKKRFVALFIIMLALALTLSMGGFVWANDDSTSSGQSVGTENEDNEGDNGIPEEQPEKPKEPEEQQPTETLTRSQDGQTDGTQEEDPQDENEDDGVIDSGTCGAEGVTLTWEITGTDSNLTLTISGEGRMAGYSSYYFTSPWIDYRESIKSIVIDEGVSSIGKYAFLDISNLTSITIPDTVTSIGESAFSGCSNLSKIKIPSTVTGIGKGAFNRCENLKSAGPIGSGSDYEFGWTDSIPANAFSGLNGLTSITIPDSIESIGYYVFEGCASLESIIIPERVTFIGDYAFNGCTSLSKITVPSSVTTMGSPDYVPRRPVFSDCDNLKSAGPIGSGSDYEFGWTDSIPANAFSGLNGLTSITIPNEVTSIGKYAFSGCASLSKIKISSSVTSIGNNAFNRCESLKSAGPIGSGSDYEFGWTDSIPANAFGGLSGLTSITMPDTVTSIGSGAFSGCSSLASIKIPAKVSDIGSYAFSGCASLKTAGPIGSGCNYEFGWTSYIQRNAFYGCGIRSITIPDTVTSIGQGAFCDCSSLTSIILPDRVKSIGDNAFSGCASLSKIKVPAAVTEIRNGAFNRCENLKSAGPIGSGSDYEFGWTDSIPSHAFRGLSGLTSITIPDTVTSIGEYAFGGCVNLKSAGPIGSGSDYEFGWTDSIPANAFRGLSGLTSIKIPAKVRDIGSFAFSGCASLKTAGPIGSGSDYEFGWTTSIPTHAFSYCSGLTSITFPGSITSIGDSAFSYCSSLTTLEFEGTKKEWNEVSKGSGNSILNDIFCLYYSINYHLDDGVKNSNPLKAKKSGTVVTLSDPSWNHHDFTGWYDSPDHENRIETISTDEDEIDVYAGWEAKHFTITYVLSGGDNDTDNPSSYTFDSETITLKDATRNAYKFDGWFRDSGYGEHVKMIPKGSSGNITLYAKWTPIDYTIQYELRGGTNNAANPSTYNVEQGEITLKDPTWDYREFDGWYSDPNHEHKVTKITKDNYKGLVLYAKWNTKPFSIEYVLNGGENSALNPTNYTIDSETIELKDPSRQYYEFDGWFADEDYTQRITKIETGSTGNLKLRAKWTPVKFDITYELRGGTNSANNPTKYDVEMLPLTFYNPQKPNHRFAGWYTSENYEEAFAITGLNKGQTGDITIYAKWDEIPVESLSVSPDPAIVVEGNTIQMTANVYPQNATNKTVTWSVGDESIASVDADGLVRGLATGQTTISARSANGKTAKCSLTVLSASNPTGTVSSVIIQPNCDKLKWVDRTGAQLENQIMEGEYSMITKEGIYVKHVEILDAFGERVGNKYLKANQKYRLCMTVGLHPGYHWVDEERIPFMYTNVTLWSTVMGSAGYDDDGIGYEFLDASSIRVVAPIPQNLTEAKFKNVAINTNGNKPIVEVNGFRLTEGTDYTIVAIDDNTSVGSVRVKIRGCSGMDVPFYGTLQGTYIILCKSHTYGAWKTTKEPTYTEEGSREKVCSKCGDKVTESIPKLKHTGWQKVDGEWYYFRSDGEKATNAWAKDSKGWCWMDGNGRITKSKWIKSGGEWYYLKPNGYMAANEWTKDSGGWYWMNGSGKIAKNVWTKDSSGWYWMNASGRIAKNAWAKDSKGWCWMGSDGHMVKSKWVKYRNNWYYLNASGYMVTGTQKIGGKTYRFDKSGKLIS